MRRFGREARTGFTLIELIIVIGIIGVLAAIATPSCHRGSRPRANYRACLANQKTIAGALEMYNLDWCGNGKPVQTLTPYLLKTLTKEGYLQSVPQDPGQGHESAGNYVSIEAAETGVGCLRHGVRYPPDQVQAGSARTQLVALGVKDELILERASTEPVSSYPSGPRSWVPTVQGISAILVQILTLITVVWGIVNGFLAIGSWLFATIHNGFYAISPWIHVGDVDGSDGVADREVGMWTREPPIVWGAGSPRHAHARNSARRFSSVAHSHLTSVSPTSLDTQDRTADPAGITWVESARCPVCGQNCAPEIEEVLSCDSCHVLHHRDCQEYLGRCGIYGCGERAVA